MRAAYGRSVWLGPVVLLMALGCARLDVVVPLSHAAQEQPPGTQPPDNPDIAASLSHVEQERPPGTAASNSPDIVVSLSYVAQGQPLGMAARHKAAGGPRLDTEAPREMRNVPPATSATRYWGQLQLGSPEKPNQFVLFIDDAESPPLRMYLDANQDGDLGNDPGPVANQGTGAFACVLDLKLSYPGVADLHSYRMWFFINGYSWRTQGCNFYSRCHRRGTLTVAGRKLPLVLFDNPADGDYSNDPLVVDLNGNGKAEEDEKFWPGDVIGDTRLRLKSISPAGDRVELTPVR